MLGSESGENSTDSSQQDQKTGSRLMLDSTVHMTKEEVDVSQQRFT